jgi:hypothetical protein
VRAKSLRPIELRVHAALNAVDWNFDAFGSQVPLSKRRGKCETNVPATTLQGVVTKCLRCKPLTNDFNRLIMLSRMLDRINSRSMSATWNLAGNGTSQ